MKTPPFLEPGDKIGLVATARKISYEELKPAINKLSEWGFNPGTSPNLFAEDNQYAGDDKTRIRSFQTLLDDPEIKAILCVRGGYGTVRIIDSLNFTRFIQNPKWIIGYSDVTVLHAHIHRNFGVETLHATMPLNFPADGSNNDSLLSMYAAISGHPLEYSIPSFKLNRNGETEGVLMGGNLSILYSLLGSNSLPDSTGKILFIEDLDEYLYHIDRMMMALKRAGMLKSLSGLIVGGMSEMKDNTIPFGKTAEEIIAEHVSEYNYPVCFQFPAGHQPDNYALILGRKIRLQIGNGVTLQFLTESQSE